MKQDEFKGRYIIKITSSVVIAVINAVIQLILPKALSVSEYGLYSYNLNVFTAVVSFTNLSMSSALISKFSKRNEEKSMFVFYMFFYSFMTIILNIAIMVFYSIGNQSDKFGGQTLFVVMLALETALILKLQSDLIGVFDAMAISRFPAIMQIVVKILTCIVVVSSYYFGTFNMCFFYIVQILILSFSVVIMITAFNRNHDAMFGNKNRHKNRGYLYEFYIYCRPLVLSSGISQLIIIFMNWALLKWSGEEQQAFFGVALQMNILISYVFSPFAELSKREFAILTTEKDKLKHRFETSLELMFWLTCYFALFLGINSKWILFTFFGEKYSGATTVLMLIMFYTIYQSWGQLCGSFFLAAEQTKTSAKLGIISQIINVICIYMFQVPNIIWKDSLGSMGIALTYFVSNIIIATVQVKIICRNLNIPFLKVIQIQVIPITICSSVLLVLYKLIDGLFADTSAFFSIIKILISGVIYTGILFCIFWKKPRFIGLDIKTLVSYKKKNPSD